MFYSARADRRIVNGVRRILEDQSFRILDWDRGLEGTREPIIQRIWDAVDKSHRIVAILQNEDGSPSPNVLYEVGYAHGRRPDRVVTVALEDQVANLPFDLRSLQHVVWENDDQRFRERLVPAVSLAPRDEFDLLLRRVRSDFASLAKSVRGKVLLRNALDVFRRAEGYLDREDARQVVAGVSRYAGFFRSVVDRINRLTTDMNAERITLELAKVGARAYADVHARLVRSLKDLPDFLEAEDSIRKARDDLKKTVFRVRCVRSARRSRTMTLAAAFIGSIVGALAVSPGVWGLHEFRPPSPDTLGAPLGTAVYAVGGVILALAGGWWRCIWRHTEAKFGVGLLSLALTVSGLAMLILPRGVEDWEKVARIGSLGLLGILAIATVPVPTSIDWAKAGRRVLLRVIVFGLLFMAVDLAWYRDWAKIWAVARHTLLFVGIYSLVCTYFVVPWRIPIVAKRIGSKPRSGGSSLGRGFSAAGGRI